MTNSPKNTTPTANPVSHKVRTFSASIFGIIGVCLIIASISVVWLNQTLTNTSTYVKTVTPLITKPAIQNFIAEKVTDQITSHSSLQNLAATLLPNSQLNAEQQVQIQQQVNSEVQQNVLKIIESPSFVTLWKSTNQTAHAALVQQLNNTNLNAITINLSPTVNAVITDLKTTPLASVVNQSNFSASNGVVTIKSNNLNRFHKYYEWFKEVTIGMVLLAIVLVAASVFLSVYHGKTARRILLVSGILLILQGLILEAPTVINIPGNDRVTQAASKAFVEVIVRNLQIATLVIGVIFVVAALGSKLYSKTKNKQLISKR